MLREARGIVNGEWLSGGGPVRHGHRAWLEALACSRILLEPTLTRPALERDDRARAQLALFEDEEGARET